MRRITISVPDELAEDLTVLASTIGVSKSAFLSVYLGKRIKRLSAIAVEFEHLHSDVDEVAIRNRGGSAQEVLDVAESIINHFENEGNTADG